MIELTSLQFFVFLILGMVPAYATGFVCGKMYPHKMDNESNPAPDKRSDDSA